MSRNKVMIAGITAALLGSGLWQGTAAFAKEVPAVSQAAAYGPLTEAQVASTVSAWMKKVSYVQRGGSYAEGDYKTFIYKNKTYRYLSKDIDTKKEMLRYLTQNVTVSYAELFMKERGIIEYKGKLAQPEADGGSLLQWEKAESVYLKTVKNERIYKIIVPVENTKEKSIYQVHMQQAAKKTWKISRLTHKNDISLDIPGNINPAFIFFHYLLIDSKVSEAQLSSKQVLNVNAFKKGITKVEIRSIEEKGLIEDKAEYMVTFHVDTAKNYKGSLKKGENRMFFLIENTGEMEFKIVSAGTASHLQ